MKYNLGDIFIHNEKEYYIVALYSCSENQERFNYVYINENEKACFKDKETLKICVDSFI